MNPKTVQCKCMRHAHHVDITIDMVKNWNDVAFNSKCPICDSPVPVSIRKVAELMGLNTMDREKIVRNFNNKRNRAVATSCGPGPSRHLITSDICRRCGRHLTNPRSRKHGYGPACYKKRMTGDLRQTKQFEPCTVIDDSLARKVYQAIYRLVSRMDETVHPVRWKCHSCGTEVKEMPLESFDCDEGVILPGFGAPQWIYLHDTHYDLAIWKIGITNEAIIAEMKAHGDIP